VLSRREFCVLAGCALGEAATPFSIRGLSASPLIDVAAIDRVRVLHAGAAYLKEKPVTITSASSPRSAGGKHDYFSEGDYWWPDPKNPDGPYIRRDGMSNPDNFVAHREALIRLSVHMPALAAAWLLTHDKKYADHAASHLRAWFIDPDTWMNPNLQYAQAIHGITTGRGTGVIDTIHLVEVARATAVLADGGALEDDTYAGIRKWFADYAQWMTTSKNGIEEREAKNNHGTCWVFQVAEFARLTRNTDLLKYATDRYKTVLLPTQMKIDGSFPLELARTKPYSYSLFNLDVMTTLCRILSSSEDDVLKYELPDGRGMRKAIAFMYPYIKNKGSWPFPHDVEYFDDLPVRQPNLLFGGLEFSQPEYLSLWKTLNPDPKVPEIIRNFPIRQPVLWVNS
jgi:Alginate lyase